MTNRFMMSVAAAALIAGTGFANAQGTGGREAPSAAPAQQSAPASERAAPSSATPANRSDASDKAAPAAKTTQSDEKMQPGAAKSQRAQDDMKVGPKGEKSAQDNMRGEKSKSMSSENDNAKGGSKDLKAEGRDDRNGMKAEGRTGSDTRGPADKNLNAETKGAADSKATTTTGQAGAGAKLSTEQRTKITTVIKEQHVQPVTNVNFSISVGTRVPREVGFHPLPTEIVSIYPQWRGYEYILVRDQILVINPRTLEIVDVIDV
jgi:Protein of unknown function (DUF1236)